MVAGCLLLALAHYYGVCEVCVCGGGGRTAYRACEPSGDRECPEERAHGRRSALGSLREREKGQGREGRERERRGVGREGGRESQRRRGEGEGQSCLESGRVVVLDTER